MLFLSNERSSSIKNGDIIENEIAQFQMFLYLKLLTKYKILLNYYFNIDPLILVKAVQE